MGEDQSKEQLKALIESAFKDVSYPGDDKIVNVEHFVDPDVRETQDNFRGRHWRDVSLERLNLNHDSVYYFTPEAFRFYLPAYMIGMLNWDGRDEGDMLLISLHSMLKPNWYNKDFKARMEGLTPQQSDAVQAFLECIKDAYPHYLGTL